MRFRLAADAVLIVHLAFVLWATLGGFAVFRWPRLAWLHLPALVWGVFIEFSGRVCPLTPLEVHLRERGGQAGYSGGFIEHYVSAWIYPDGLTRNVQWLLGSVLLVINVVMYSIIVRRALTSRA